MLTDNENAVKHLKKVEAEKISFEETLYKKFLNLLNSKKLGTACQGQPSTSKFYEQTFSSKTKSKIFDTIQIIFI